MQWRSLHCKSSTTSRVDVVARWVVEVERAASVCHDFFVRLVALISPIVLAVTACAVTRFTISRFTLTRFTVTAFTVTAFIVTATGCPLAGACTDDGECPVGVCRNGACVNFGGAGGEGEGEGEAAEGEGEAAEGEGEGAEGEGEGVNPFADDVFVLGYIGQSVDVPFAFIDVDVTDIVDVDLLANGAPPGCEASNDLVRAQVSCGAQQLGDVSLTYQATLDRGVGDGAIISNVAQITVRFVPLDWDDLLRRQRLRIALDDDVLASNDLAAADVEGQPMFIPAETLPAGALLNPSAFNNGTVDALDVDGDAGIFVRAPGASDELFLYFDALGDAPPGDADPFGLYEGVWHLDGVNDLDDAASIGPDGNNALQVLPGASTPPESDGVFGSARTFVGAARLAVVDPAALAIGGNTGTLSMWLRPIDTAAPDARIGVYANGGDVLDDDEPPDGFGDQDEEVHVGLHINNDLVNGYVIADVGDTEINGIGSSLFAPPGEWTFLAMTWQGGQLTLHSNGRQELVTGSIIGGTALLDDFVVIGGPLDLLQRSAAGDIDEVRVSRAAVSPERLAFEYLSGTTRVHRGAAPPTQVFITTVQAATAVPVPLVRVPSEVFVLIARDPSSAVTFSGLVATQLGDEVDAGDFVLELHVATFLDTPPEGFDAIDASSTAADAVLVIWQSVGPPRTPASVLSTAESPAGSLILAGEPGNEFAIAGSWLVVASAARTESDGVSVNPTGIAPDVVSLDDAAARPFDVDVRLIIPNPTLESVAVETGTNTAGVLIRAGFTE